MGRTSKKKKRQIFDPNAAFRSIIGGETIRQAEADEEADKNSEYVETEEKRTEEEEQKSAYVQPEQPVIATQVTQMSPDIPVETSEPSVSASDRPEPPVNPAKRGRPKVTREIKKRVSLAVLPSLYQDFQRIAYMERKSVSQLIATCMEQYLLDNLEKLDEYEQMSKK